MPRTDMFKTFPACKRTAPPSEKARLQEQPTFSLHTSSSPDEYNLLPERPSTLQQVKTVLPLQQEALLEIKVITPDLKSAGASTKDLFLVTRQGWDGVNGPPSSIIMTLPRKLLFLSV